MSVNAWYAWIDFGSMDMTDEISKDFDVCRKFDECCTVNIYSSLSFKIKRQDGRLKAENVNNLCT